MGLNNGWPIIHLYGPDYPHGEQIIACNEAGLILLYQLVVEQRNLVEPYTDDGEGYHLHLLVTDETEKLPIPYTDATTIYGSNDWTWLVAKIRQQMEDAK